VEISNGKRHILWDTEGHRYIDFTSGGIFAAVLGANNSALKMAANAPPIQCAYGHRFRNKYADRLIGMLKDLTGYESVCLFSTGSEATEAFWRACRVFTGKAYVWGGLVDPDMIGEDKPDPPCDAMHGWTLGAMIMAGKTFNPVRLGGVEEIGKQMFGGDHTLTGCAIFEPYHAPSAQFHHENPTIARIRENMRTFKDDIHFCCDEVQGGLGRAGKLFAHEWYPDIRPEFVCLGKALGGGYPVSALLGPKDVLEDPLVVENANLHSTHSGHPIMAAVACKVLEILQRDDLINMSYVLGRELAEYLKDCGVRYHAGRGLLAGLEFQGPLEASKVVEACERRGLLVVETGRKWVKLGPPYIITEEDMEEGVNRLKDAIEEVLSETRGPCESEHKGKRCQLEKGHSGMHQHSLPGILAPQFRWENMEDGSTFFIKTDSEACGDPGEQPGPGGGVLPEDGVSAGEILEGEVAEGYPGHEDGGSGGAGSA
jgi:acetylornithine/succinyldiaminopimelate/putrescine aminotransferase